MSTRSRLIAFATAAVFAVSGFGPMAQAASSQHHVAKSTSALKLIHPGYLTVGSDTTYPPQEFKDPKTKKYMGADIDLANALAKAMGLKGAKIISVIFDSAIPDLKIRHSFDVIMSSMNDTPARRRQIAFVDYMRAGEGILVKKSSPIHANGYGQICGHSVSVETSTTELAGMQAANRGPCKKHAIDIHQYKADTDAFEAFTTGHTDAYSGDGVVVLYYVKQHPSALRPAGKIFAASEDYGIGLLKNATALKSALTKALTKIRANGQYKRILTKWGVASVGL